MYIYFKIVTGTPCDLGRFFADGLEELQVSPPLYFLVQMELLHLLHLLLLLLMQRFIRAWLILLSFAAILVRGEVSSLRMIKLETLGGGGRHFGSDDHRRCSEPQ